MSAVPGVRVVTILNIVPFILAYIDKTRLSP
ncbi:MAG: hypothetical protein N5P05_002645 [Chroococcopsis gigantea SAG 12.99]|nr:hypothetical protein [Chroococcopsis gigantea SAG 12.99]